MKKKNERGEIMIEGMIVVLVTMFLLTWLIAIGFVYYQRYLVTAITNDACARVAATYNNADGDIMMGFVSPEDITERNLYRNASETDAQFAINKEKATQYINYRLKKTNFVGTIKSVDVKMQLVNDSPLRQHIKIETEVTFNTPLGIFLDFFGMGSTNTYYSSARSDNTDIIDYMSKVDFGNYVFSGSAVSSKVVKLINSLIGVYNKFQWVQN